MVTLRNFKRKAWWTFRIFFIFSARGRGRGQLEAPGGGGRFFYSKSQEGVSPGRVGGLVGKCSATRCSVAAPPPGARHGLGGPMHPRHPLRWQRERCDRGLWEGCSCDTPATHSELRNELRQGCSYSYTVERDRGGCSVCVGGARGRWGGRAGGCLGIWGGGAKFFFFFRGRNAHQERVSQLSCNPDR